jgi:DNA-binding CsgD family transcriptional regulator/tetratricopeptide (TPR) repeat protein
MELIEREQQLQSLADVWQHACAGRGRIALVSGEAGIGKTTLIEHFVADRAGGAHVLRGGCDALFSPQPLGPFVEIAAQTEQTDLQRLAHAGGDRLAFSAALFLYLQKQPAATLIILEDLHWADEATLDVVKYLGRRIHHTPALLLLSYRDDEISGDHPLRSLLGDLPAQATLRLALPRLSAAAVEQLAQQTNRPLEGLYRITNGNPFFVTEVLGSQSEGVPPSVRDAVLARAARLSPAARAVVELVSLVPGSAEGRLIAELLQPDPAVLDECIERGILRPVGRSLARRDLAFRHELARQSIEDTLPIGRARGLHGRILAALLPREGGDVSLARLVHHAVRAGDEATTLRLAPRAAQQAAKLGAHREALSLYTTLLRYADRLAPAAQAEILEALSIENYLIDRPEDAITARRQAMDIWQRLGRGDHVGDGYRWLSRFYWMVGNGAEAEKCGDQAIAILEAYPPGPQLAMAYSSKSQLHMLAWEEAPSLEWGRRAIALAERMGNAEIWVHATTNVGSTESLGDFQGGIEKVELALQLAREHEMHDHVGRCYSNLTSNHVRSRRYAGARRWSQEGLEYTTARDLDSYTIYILGWQSQGDLDTGQWAEAEADALEALRLVQKLTITALPALVTLGRLRLRQGDPAADALLTQAYDLALPTRELQRHAPVAAARAEAAWLRGEPERIPAVAGLGYSLARQRNDPWILGELAYWMWRAGHEDIPLERLAFPFAEMIRGRWQAAAAAWEEIGCPYERALALSDGDETAQLQALALFEALGATAAASLLRRQLQAHGVPGAIAPTPRRRTLAADELTPRELEVLRLLAAGLSNPAIATRLIISVGTVKAHTANIYGKLGVANRVQALSRAQERHLL